MQFNNKGINISEDITGFLSIGLVGPPRPWDRQKSPPLVGLSRRGKTILLNDRLHYYQPEHEDTY